MDPELRKFQGRWRVTRSLQSGQPSPGHAELVIQGDYFERKTSDQVFTRTIKVDSSHDPKWIDLLITNEPDKGKVSWGIYEIDGTQMRICHSLPGVPRPTRFSSALGSHHVLSISEKIEQVT